MRRREASELAAYCIARTTETLWYYCGDVMDDYNGRRCPRGQAHRVPRTMGLAALAQWFREII